MFHNLKFSRYYEIVVTLFQQELTVRYKKSILGYLWSIANPLAYAILFYFIFDSVVKLDVENYALFLITGLFPWQAISNVLTSSHDTYIENRNIIKKVSFPNYLINVSKVLQNSFHFVVSLPVIFVFAIIYNEFSIWYLVHLPILIVLHFMLCLSLNIICSSINVFFRDFERLIQIGIIFLFYLTPIVYTLDMVPSKYQIFAKLNPVAGIVISFRRVFLDQELNHEFFYLSIGWIFILCYLAFRIYKKLSWRFPESL